MADETERPSWFRETPESLRALSAERRRLDLREATYGLDKRQARRVRRQLSRPVEGGR